MIKNNYIRGITNYIRITLLNETVIIIDTLKNNLLEKAKNIGNKNDVKFISSVNVDQFESIDEFLDYIRSGISFSFHDELVYACLGAKVSFHLDERFGYLFKA